MKEENRDSLLSEIDELVKEVLTAVSQSESMSAIDRVYYGYLMNRLQDQIRSKIIVATSKINDPEDQEKLNDKRLF